MTLHITSLTTDYDQSEDRIRLAVADAQNNARLLWLTRRLCERLGPALINSLPAKLAKPDAPPSEALPARARRTEAQAAQVYAQLEARLSKKPGKPVALEASAAHSLVHEIKVKTAANGACVLLFQCRDAESAELRLRPAELRQWLEMLRRVFDKGQWRADIWPDWLQGRSRSKS